MTGAPDFSVEVYQNEYLSVGATEVNAIITVTASGGGGPVAVAAPAGSTAEVIIIDTSGSMHVPRTKLSSAKQATAAAIDTLRDGVAFAVIAGTDEARLVYPYRHGLEVASEQTRTEAKQAVAKLSANGGTAIGKWLRLADSVFSTQQSSMRHAILLTDGQNMHDRVEAAAAVARRGTAATAVATLHRGSRLLGHRRVGAGRLDQGLHVYCGQIVVRHPLCGEHPLRVAGVLRREVAVGEQVADELLQQLGDIDGHCSSSIGLRPGPSSGVAQGCGGRPRPGIGETPMTQGGR